MEYDHLNISFSIIDKSADLVNVKVNGEEQKKVVPKNDFECFSVLLSAGMNEIEIVAKKGDITAEKVHLMVFRRSDLESRYRKIPKGFKKVFFHKTKNPKCSGCHKLEHSEFDKIPLNPAKFTTENFNREAVIKSTSTCYSCHKRITSSEYIHGPASVWSCLSCHSPDTEPKFSVRKPVAPVCFNCHKEQESEWYAKKKIHGPVNIGMCTICHSPHGSENPFNLYKPTWDLCVTCHEERASGTHVIAGFLTGNTHPTRDRPDPVRYGKELSCASCHNPHASDSKSLFRYGATDRFSLCIKCHKGNWNLQ